MEALLTTSPLSESTPIMDPKVERKSERYVEDINQNGQRNDPCAISSNAHEGQVDNNTDAAKSKEKFGIEMLRSLSKRKQFTLFFVTTASSLVGVTSCMLSPIFPIVAAKKGMNTTLTGLVFGLFGLVTFFTAPLFGSYLTKWGPKFTFVSGILIAGCSNVIFGFVQYCPSGMPFIVLSILVRCMEALGYSAYITSSCTIVANEFRESMGLIIGIVETANGFGFFIGPAVGGALYELGGFGLPFYVVGVLVLVNGFFAYTLVPPIQDIPNRHKGSILTLLRSPLVIILVGSLLFGQMGMTAFYATFAKHAAQLNLSVGQIGICIGVGCLLYSLTSLLWGYLSDSLDLQFHLIIGGAFALSVGFLLIGPSVLLPFIPFNLTTICIGIAFIDASYGCIFIPTMKCMVIGAVEMGLKDNIDTYAQVSGLFNAAHDLGVFIGPVGIGALVQDFGYPISYTVLGMVNIFWAVVGGVFFTARHLRRKNTHGK